jgi:protein phosphatase
VRDGVAQQITKDQSLMQKLVEAGELTAEEAEVSERRNIILQALGPEPVVKVDLTHQQVRRGDTVVLCSDGLSGQMRASDIADIVAGEPDLVQVCKQLIDLANENGGPDNITVIAARFEGDGLSVASNDESVGHRVYTSDAESRVTMPVHASALPPMTAEEEASMAATPTDNPVPLRTSFGGDFPAPLSDPASLGPPERRVSLATLRLIFGAIGLLIGLAIIYKYNFLK